MQAYAKNRARLRVTGAGDAEEEEEEEDLRTRLSKMTDEEFKKLAMERKQRADTEVNQEKGTAGAAAAGKTADAPTSARGGKPAGKKKQVGLFGNVASLE